MKIRKSSKRPVKASKRMKLGRKIMASRGNSPALYIEENAGGYGLIATDGNGWFYFNDAPDGEFLGVDIHQGDPDAVAEQIIEALNSGEWDLTSIRDVIEYAQTSGDWTPIPEWRGMTIDDIDSDVNYNSDGTPIGHDVSSWTEVEASTKIRASRRAVKASSDSYWKVWMSYATEDGSPAELQGTAIEEVFDRAMPYDKKYYRGHTYFTEKFFDNEADARAYKAKFDRYVGVNIADIESSRTVRCSTKIRADRNDRKITASTGKKIPYDLVSMAAILRDWVDMPRDAYASDEHKLLADIADTLYNVGKESAKTFQKKYAELYKQYGEAYFDQVLDDMAALDSQVSSKNIEELVEAYEDRLDSGIGAATKIRASRASKRSVTASRPIMTGPGAGYTVEWDLNTVDSVKSIKPISTEVNEYGEVCVDAECDIEIGLTINAASSYYEGADSLDIETTATISRIYLEIPVADYETPEDVIAQIPYMGATDLDSLFYDIDALGAWKSNLGGGYSHSTFNGVLADADDPHSVSEGMEGWTITLTDKEVIDYIDQVVTGEDTYTGYALYDQDGEYIDKFENLMDAQNKAEELIASGEYESIECVREDTKIYFDDTSEEVYNETEFVIDEPADI